MASKPPFSTICICGPGLLGGSIALAVREYLPQCELRLWARREESLNLARNMGVTDFCFTDVQEAVRGADLVVLATPIGAFEELTRLMLPALDPQALVTDIGSVKAYVHRTTGALLMDRGRFFIGSHPMAGAETQGLENASAALLHGATVALTNEHGAPTKLLNRLRRFWSALACRPYVMEAANHDRAVARISHMPHVLAALCARGALDPTQANDVPLQDLQRLAAGGFRDTTRVSAGPPNMWADILWENDVAVRETLAHCVQDLQKLIDLLAKQDKPSTAEWLQEGKDARRIIRREKP